MEEWSLRGRAALVTGGASGIGAYLASQLASAGALIGVLDRNADRVAEVTERILAAGGNAHALLADLADRTAVAQAVARFAARHGRLDALVTCARVLRNQPLLAMDAESWRVLAAVNVGATLAATGAAAPIMVGQRYGRIVHLDPCASYAGDESRHSLARAVLAPLTRSFALRLREADVTVNCVVPALPSGQGGPPGGGPGHPIGLAALARAWVSPPDVAAAVRFLASPQAGFVSGQVFHVQAAGVAIPAPRNVPDLT